MRPVSRTSVILTVLGLALLTVWSCGGGTQVKASGTAHGSLSGVVVKGPVNGATVTAYRADSTLTRGEALVSGPTDETGAFSLALPPWGGPILVVATGGTYREEALGLGVPLSVELSTLIPDYASGATVTGLRLTPVSTWAVAKAGYHARTGTPLPEAWSVAFAHLSAHVGGGPWDSATPGDVAAPATLGPEGRNALMLAALSQEAMSLALASHLSPGLTVNAGTLTQALADDLAFDGTWNGLGATGRLTQGSQSLDGQSVRLALSQALLDFVGSAQNGTGLTVADVRGMATALAAAKDAYLFCEGQDPARCGTGASDIDAPAITIQSPVDGAVARGSIDLLLAADDASKVKTFAFTAPPSLASVAPTLSTDGRHASLAATLDVSALPDGDVAVRVQATDEWNNSSTATVHVRVSNHGPIVTIGAPSMNAVVKGTVIVSATAQSQGTGTTVTKLELLSPPPGLGPDTVPTADTFSATWDSTQAPEGPLTLRVRATDSAGGQGEASVAVVVDNVPFGIVHAAVWAGAPLQGATVRLWAVDPLTGLALAGRDGGALLGTATTSTDEDGGVTFALSQENYTGPVQLEASGTSLTVVDASDGVTSIALPSTMALTAYVPAYRTGDELRAHATLWTTIADSAARAVALGRNPSAGPPMTLVQALALTDPWMAAHASGGTAWNLRGVRPVSLTGAPQTLRDSVYASFPDVALHQLARSLSVGAGLTPGNVATAFTLTSQLSADVADGTFDGKAMGASLSIPGSPSYALDANTTRFKLAMALDAFIGGAQNKTGLVRSDLQTSNVFDAMALDAPPTNPLYPTSPAPIPFDAVPPTTTFTLTYQLTGGTVRGPVGANHLVGGRLAVVADAVDPSGVASLILSVDGQTMVPGASSSSTHALGSLDTATVPDGSYTLRARACDGVGNCSDTMFPFVVDNTPPAIATAAPVAGYYSQSVDVDATASDAHGVASFGVTSLQGFGDTDASSERILGTWVLPSGQADGPLAVALKACDVLGNCATSSSSVAIVDRTPPSLTWVSQPPAWSNSTTTITASVTASDTGAGVSKVIFNLVGGSSGPIAGTLTGGVWSATLPLPGPSLPSSTTVEVWGIDNASPSNSGVSATGAPSKLSAVTAFDRSGPVVTAGAGVAQPSYLPETAWSLKTDVNGHPLVPVQYNQFGALTAVSPGGTVYKLATTLHAADGNIPVITYQVATTNKAPITSAVLSNVVAIGTFGCTKLAGCPRSHPLTLSTRTATGYAYYDLPLTAEMLDARTGALSLTVAFTDAAGNSVTRIDTATLTVLAPPVGLYEDTSWQSASDPQSIFAYRLATNTYDKVYDSANTALHPAAQPAAARVLRYVVENPAPYPVSVDMSPGLASQFRLTETWNNNKYDQQAISPGGTTAVDLITLQNFVRLDPNAVCTDGTVHYHCRFNSSGLPYEPAPPPPPKCQGECWRDFMSSGTASSTMQCQVNYYNWTAASTAYNPVNASTNVLAFSDFKTSGNETTPAQQYYSPSLAGMTGAIVPAASATTPGLAVFYYMAPLPASTRAALGFDPLTWQSLAETPTHQYQRTVGWFYKLAANEGTFCAGASAKNEGYHLNKMNRQLTTATWLLTVTPSIKTGAFTVLDATTPVVEGWPTGVPSSALPPISGRTWSH